MASIALLGLTSLVGGLSLLVQLKVSSVTCQSQYGECPEMVREFGKRWVGESWMRSWVKIGKQTKEHFPWLKQAQVKPGYWGQLKLNIAVPKAIVALQAVNQLGKAEEGFKDLVLVDKQGQVVGVARDSYLPRVGVIQLSWDKNHSLAPEWVKMVKIIHQLKMSGDDFSQAQARPGQLWVKLTRGIRVIFPLNEKGEDELVNALHLILTRATIGQEYSEVDLRFSKPVVR